MSDMRMEAPGAASWLAPELLAFVFGALSDPEDMSATKALREACGAGVDGFDIAGTRGFTHLAASLHADVEDGCIASQLGTERQWFPVTYRSSARLPGGGGGDGDDSDPVRGGLPALVKLEALRFVDEERLTLARRLGSAWTAPHLVACFPPSHRFTTTHLEAISTCAPHALTVYAPARVTGGGGGDRVLHVGMDAALVRQRLRSVDLSGCEEFSAISGGIATGALALRRVVLPEKLASPLSINGPLLCDAAALKAIDLAGLAGITKLDSGFLRGCSALQDINLSPLASVRAVGDRFLSGCAALKTVDVSVMGRLEEVGSRFLHKCLALERIDMCNPSLTAVGAALLSKNESLVSATIRCRQLRTLGIQAFSDCAHLRKLTVASDEPWPGLAVGSGFAYRCPNLVAANLSAFGKATRAGNEFLYRCKSLKSVDLAPLVSLTTIGLAFLSRTGLTGIDLSPLANVRSVGSGFLCLCPALTQVDFSSLTQLRALDCALLCDCDALTDVSLQGLDAVTAIGTFVFANTPCLKSLDLRPVHNVTAIGAAMCRDSVSLAELNMTGLSQLSSIEGAFCSRALSLKRIVGLSTLTGLESVGNDLFRGCAQLVELDIHGLTSLCAIGDNCAAGCRSLTSLSLQGCPKLTRIGKRFAADCPALEAVDLRGLSAVTALPEGFMVSNIGLKRIDFRPLVGLTAVGRSVLAGCRRLEWVNFAGLTGVKDVAPSAFQHVKCATEAFIVDGASGELAAALQPLRKPGGARDIENE